MLDAYARIPYLYPLTKFPVAKDLLTQWHEAVWSAERPLFVLPAGVDTDMFASACALGHALQAAGKSVSILCPRTMSTHADFLTGNLPVTKTLEETKTYQCNIPSHISVKNITHEIYRDGGGIITLHLDAPIPEMQTITYGQTNVSLPASLAPLTFSHTLPSFDRIITFGAKDLSEIAPLFGDMHELIMRIPIVSITWQPSSESFGRWNISYEQATTLSEVVSSFLHDTSPESVKDDVATCLLAGIIAKTKHFRSDAVTPAMLTMAANLVAAGANRLQIIEELYRTRSVDSLRLWGAACARLQEIVPGVLFSELTEDDFLRTHTSPDALPDIAQEVLQSSEQTKKIIFFFTQKDLLQAYVVAKRPLDARVFMGALRTEGTRETAQHTFTTETKVADILPLILASEKRSS